MEVYVLIEVFLNWLKIIYFEGISEFVFNFVVFFLFVKRDVQLWVDIYGILIFVLGNVNLEFEIIFFGWYGGVGSLIYDYNYWSFVYKMLSGFEGIFEIIIKFD